MLIQIAISVGFLLACGLVLAGLLLLAEKKILNYGTCHIDINAGRKVLDVDGGASLLSSLAQQDIRPTLSPFCGSAKLSKYFRV